MQDASNKGRVATGDKLPQTKIHGSDLEHVLYMAKSGVKYQEIADIYGVTKSCIGCIARKNNIKRNKK